jgi:prephenate dehydrogenase
MPLNITIIGLDAVGASLGLALGTIEPTALSSGRPTITGWDDDRRTLRDARGRLAIDREARDLVDAVREADLVFVSTPTDKLGATFDAIAPHVKHGAIVSDVSSAKALALQEAQLRLPTTVSFISGHPLVSPTGSDLRAASLDLFKNTIYCLLPGAHTHASAIDVLDELVTVIGAKPYYIDATEHDAYIAAVSQLPLLVSAALMETISRSGGWREMQPIAGAPLRTATQLVNADPAASSVSSQSNQVAVERWINELIRTLVELRDNLDNREQLEAFFDHAREAHEQWLDAQPNMRPGENDFYQEPEDVRRGIGAMLFGQRKRNHDKKR